MKTTKTMMFVIFLSLFLTGCWTTGKDTRVKSTIDIKGNYYTTVNIYPDLATKSGDTKSTSSNDTDLQDLIDVPVEQVMERAIEKAVDTELLENLPITTKKEETTDSEVITNDLIVKEENKLGTWSCVAYTRSTEEKSACRVSVDFNKHDYPVLFKFNNGCGEFTIPTANAEFDENGKEGYYFHKFHKGSPVAFTEAGCVASEVTAYKVESEESEEEKQVL